MLRRYVRPNFGRKSTGGNTASGFAGHVSANDRPWVICANCPLQARSPEVCDAAGGAVAPIARGRVSASWFISSFARSTPWADRGEFFVRKAQATLSEPYFLLLSQSMMFSANTA